MNTYFDDKRLLRLHDIIGCKKRGITPIIPVSRFTWYNGIKSGAFPQPVKLSARTSAWRTEDILSLIKQQSPLETSKPDQNIDDSPL